MFQQDSFQFWSIQLEGCPWLCQSPFLPLSMLPLILLCLPSNFFSHSHKMFQQDSFQFWSIQLEGCPWLCQSPFVPLSMLPLILLCLPSNFFFLILIKCFPSFLRLNFDGQFFNFLLAEMLFTLPSSNYLFKDYLHFIKSINCTTCSCNCTCSNLSDVLNVVWQQLVNFFICSLYQGCNCICYLSWDTLHQHGDLVHIVMGFVKSIIS